jgi:uncharacterized repeat protein (TIGR02543 family)
VSLGKALGILLLLSLAFGVAAAGGRVQTATPVVIEVIGQGKVTGPGVDCGLGAQACYPTFSAAGTATLTAGGPASGWTFAGWGDTGDTDCFGSPATTCSVPVDGSAHQITATFTTASASSTRTLFTGVAGNTGGKVTGGHIDCGSGPSTDCSWEVLTGSTLTVVETPDPGYVFTGWGGACGATRSSCTVTMVNDKTLSPSFALASAAHTLTATVAGNGSVTGGGIDCPAGSTCSTPEAAGAYVTLTATSNEGAIFTGWSGDCTGSTTTCTVQMTADKHVTATFAATFTLSVSVSGSGTVTGSGINCGTGGSLCSASFPTGTSVTLTATPASGATFSGWSGACAGSGVTTTCTLTITAANSVTASFTSPTATVPLSVGVSGSGTVTGPGISCGNGASVCGASVAAGTTVTLTETPAAGATFTGWGSSCSGTATTCTVKVNTSTSVSASFTTVAASTYRLAVSVTGSGRVLGALIACGIGFSTCEANEPANATVTLTASSLAGASFKGWGGSCSGTSKTCQVLMDAAKTVSASFSAPPPKVTLTLKVVGRGIVAAPGGRCVGTGRTLTCKQRYTVGTRVTLTETPARRAAFRGWSGACTGKKATCALRLTAAKSVTASFSG